MSSKKKSSPECEHVIGTTQSTALRGHCTLCGKGVKRSSATGIFDVDPSVKPKTKAKAKSAPKDKKEDKRKTRASSKPKAKAKAKPKSKSPSSSKKGSKSKYTGNITLTE